MASASSSSAKLLFQDSKKRLSDRVTVNVNNAGSVARQVFRGSKSSDILMLSAKQTAQSEDSMNRTLNTLKKMDIIQQQMGFQYCAVQDACNQLENVKEQVHSMER